MPARVPMTEKQRAALLALPDTEEEVVRRHDLDTSDLAVVAEARTPETRLGYALQLCCLRYPGRYLRRGEVLPAIMLDHIAEQVGVGADALADFARRGATRYETDMLEGVDRWTGFISHFGHVSTGLPPTDDRAFLATLIAEATNLGLARMADVCGAASQRALLKMLTWHMREERSGRRSPASPTPSMPSRLAPGSARAGEHPQTGRRSISVALARAEVRSTPTTAATQSSRSTTITDRYAPLHQTVIAGTAGEAIHALDGILGHESGVGIGALHVDGGGVSDILFAVMHLLGLSFEPRIPRLSDRRLYAFEPRARYGRLAPLFGHRLDRELIASHWDDIGRLIGALRNRVVTPSLILKKLSAYKQQNSLAAALREVGRIQRTLLTLRWFDDPALRRLVTAELNKSEAKNSLSRAVMFHRLGRFRDRGHESQSNRAAALNFMTAAIILFNCRYLGRALDAMRLRGMSLDEQLIPQLSPLGWDHINLTGDYIWSDSLALDADGFLPLRIGGE